MESGAVGHRPSVGDCDRCAISSAPCRSRPGGPTLFAKNSDRPPDEQQRFDAPAAAAAGRRHVRATHVAVPAHPGATFVGVRLPAHVGVGARAGRQRSRCRGRQRVDLHHARPAFGARRAHRHGPRAARAGALRAGGRRRRAHRAPAARGRPGRVRAPGRAPAVLVVVPARRPPGGVRRGDLRQRHGGRGGHRHAARPPTARRSPPFDAAHRHPRQPVDALVDPRLRALASRPGRSSP